MIYYITVIWLPNLAECEIIHSARRRYIDIKAEDDIPPVSCPVTTLALPDWLIVLYRRTDWNASTEHRPRQCAGECCCDITPCAVLCTDTVLSCYLLSTISSTTEQINSHIQGVSSNHGQFKVLTAAPVWGYHSNSGRDWLQPEPDRETVQQVRARLSQMRHVLLPNWSLCNAGQGLLPGLYSLCPFPSN